MHNIREIFAKKTAEGKVILTTVSGSDNDIQRRERLFANALDGLATVQAEAKNASYKMGIGISGFFGGMGIIPFDASFNHNLSVTTVATGAALAITSIYTLHRQGNNEYEASSGERVLKELVNPGSLPEKQEIFTAPKASATSNS